MRVCYIATTAHVSGSLGEGIGSTTHTWCLARELRARGDEVVLVSDRWESDPAFEEIRGVRVHRLFRGGALSAKKAKASPWRPLLSFLKPLSNAWLAGRVAAIAQREGCDVLFERAQSKIGGLVSWWTGKPLIVEVIDNLCSGLSLARASRVFAYTDKFFDAGVRPKVELVSAGVDPEIFRPAKAIPARKWDACYVGAFKEWDGLEDLVDAVALARTERPGLTVALVGRGPRFAEVTARVKKAGLEANVELMGAKPLEDVVRTINASAVCLAPYNVARSAKGGFDKFGFYFSPLKVVEYMACGKPVVATDYELIARLLPGEGKAGGNALVPTGDARALAAALLRVLADDEGRDAAGKRNLERSRDLTWAKLAARVHRALAEAATAMEGRGAQA